MWYCSILSAAYHRLTLCSQYKGRLFYSPKLLPLMHNLYNLTTEDKSERYSQVSFSFLEYTVAQLVEALQYKSEGHGFDSRRRHWNFSLMYEACPESKDTEVLNMYNIFNLQKRQWGMNCLYITLFFNIFAGIVQTFIKSWNQLLYSRVLEVCRLPFEPGHDFMYLIIVVELFPCEMFLSKSHFADS